MTGMNADGRRTLTLSGTYEWEKSCHTKKTYGYAIAWNDSTAPGNLVANGVAVGTPSDNTIHLTNGCGVPGTFGPLSHTYPASQKTAVQVCVVTYHNKDSKKTAGGSTRQTDNSIEENKDNKPVVVNNEAEQAPRFRRTETNFGSFQRSFRLPDTVNVKAIAAEMNDGILRVTLPFDTEKVTKQVIEIR